MSLKNLIPKGFFPIAVSEFRSGTATVFFNKERGLLLVKIDEDTLMGPFHPVKLESVLHALKDVADMRGNYGALG